MSEIVKYNSEITGLQVSAMDKLNELNVLISKNESNNKSLYNLKEHNFRLVECQISDFPVCKVKLETLEFEMIKETLVRIFEQRKNKIESDLSKFNVTKNGL